MPDVAGLDPADEAVYVALLRRPSASTTELADRLGSTPDDVAERLMRLERRNLITRIAGQQRYRAAPPDLALGPVLEVRREALRSFESAVDRLRTEYRSAVALRGASDLVEVVHGIPAISQCFQQVQRAAEKEVRGLVQHPAIAVVGRDNSAEIAGLAAGVTYRVIYERSVLELADDPCDVAASIGRGEQAKVIDEVPVKMLLVDRTLALAPIQHQDADAEPTAVLVHPSGLLDALDALFESLWRAATPLSAPDGSVGVDPAAGGPSAEDLRLLALMLAGLTDHTIATQLGLSIRTVQRRIHDLAELVGARTRLQLVWQASRRGWI